jgi:hypothetical protein
MVRFVVTCPTCGTISECVYRCDDCGADLAESDSTVWRFEWPSVAGRRDDGLVRVEFPLECCRCDRQRRLELDYDAVGRVIRLGCPACDQLTKHRPVGADLDRAAAATGVLDATTPDNDPSVSTATQ